MSHSHTIPSPNAAPPAAPVGPWYLEGSYNAIRRHKRPAVEKTMCHGRVVGQYFPTWGEAHTTMIARHEKAIANAEAALKREKALLKKYKSQKPPVEKPPAPEKPKKQKKAAASEEYRHRGPMDGILPGLGAETT